MANNKVFVYLKAQDAEKWDVLLKSILDRDPRTNGSEIIRELMGFPPRFEGRPITRQADRDFLAGKITTLESPEIVARIAADEPMRAGDKRRVYATKANKVRVKP